MIPPTSSFTRPRVARCAALLLLILAFLVAPASAGARPWEGTLDPTFEPEAGATDEAGFDAPVEALALQPDGKIVIGGMFDEYRGVSRPGIARVNSDGTLDIGFVVGAGIGVDHRVYAIAVQPDGKILIGGDFVSYNGVSRPHIARLNADGTLDETFDTEDALKGAVRAIVVQPDGKVLVGGDFSQEAGGARNFVARLNADGALDTSFAPDDGPDDWVYSIARLPSGKVLIGGYFTHVDGQERLGLARLNANGTLDASYVPVEIGSGSAIVYTLVPLPDGKLIIAGDVWQIAGEESYGIVRLNADGTLDATFDPGFGANNPVYTVVRDRLGRLLVGGAFTSFGEEVRGYVARLHPNGALDTSFDPGTGADALVYAMALQPDGRVLIGGSFTTYDGTARHGIARVNAFGIHLFLPMILGG